MLPSTDKPFGLLELGSNSLKFYLVEKAPSSGYAIKTYKFPWRIAHDFFSTGRLSDETVAHLIEVIRSVEKVSEGVALSTMLAVATGVFRELPEIARLAARVKSDAGIRLRVITGEDEARLMAKGFPAREHKGSSLLCDLGGATTEWAWMENGSARAWGSLPLGAIRNEYKLGQLRNDPEGYLARSAEHCDVFVARLGAPPGTAVLATGGTAKAAAIVAARAVIPIEELREMIRRVLKDGPPASLKPDRQAVFLPGLVILERLCNRCKSPTLEYSQTSVRDGMANRLVQLLGTHSRDQLHSTLLLHTRGT